MRLKGLRILVVAVLMAVAGTALGSTRYVSDQLSVNLRSGPGTQFHITSLATAGTRVEVLEEDDGWSKVRTSDGNTGFVLTRFLADQPAARTQLASMKSKLAAIDEQNGKLKTQLSTAQDSSSALGDAKHKLLAENTRLKQQLGHIKQVSANAVQIDKQNKTLQQQLTAAQHQAKKLERQNKALESRREGMVIGAFILIVGILVGLVLPLLRRKRRRRDNW